MKYRLFLAISFIVTTYTQKIVISSEEAKNIGHKIWNNECGGSITGLTSWNVGENFASLGIGHFIWYPVGKKNVFKDTFPSLLRFLELRGKNLPVGILKKGSLACPWNNREEFLKSFDTKPMVDLRNFLASTIDLQTKFIVQRLHKALPIMLKGCVSGKQGRVRKQFYRVAKSPGGLYALIDYINFKGEGSVACEQYQGYRWGLLQVLERMTGCAPDKSALYEFAASAESVLQDRVAHAPADRNEARWLPGWKKRINTYKAS